LWDLLIKGSGHGLTKLTGSDAPAVIDFLHEYGFTQIMNFATRANNTLDVFITNRPSLIHRCNRIAGISDHEAIYIESSVTLTHQQCITKRKSYLWHKAVISGINEIIIQFTNSFLKKFSLSTSEDVLWEKFKLMCFSCLDHVPTKVHGTGTTMGDSSHKASIT